MPADRPTALSIIISALRKLGVMGAPDSTPESEDLELGLNELNEIIEQWNLRKKKMYYSQMADFEFKRSKQNYTIGPRRANPHDNPDFVVPHGGRPVRLDFAQLVLTDQWPWVQVNIAIINVEQYQYINVPALSSTFPLSIYYQPTWPDGTIWPYPAFPQHTHYRLNLTWRNQMDTIGMDEIHLPLIVPFGYRRALALTLAESLYLAFPKKTDLAKLEQQARIARADLESENRPPPKVTTTDGLNTTGQTFDWRSRQAF